MTEQTQAHTRFARTASQPSEESNPTAAWEGPTLGASATQGKRNVLICRVGRAPADERASALQGYLVIPVKKMRAAARGYLTSELDRGCCRSSR
jgi:hypothetical protein